MSGTLPAPPDALRGPPRAFYDELLKMLDVVQPARVDVAKSSVRFDDDGVEVTIAHADRDDWSILATVGDDDAIVAVSDVHEHFSPPSSGGAEERSWTTQTVDFVAEVLRGEIEIESTFRGGSPAYVRHFNRAENGERNLLGHTGVLHPGRLLVWRPKRTETIRVSFL